MIVELVSGILRRRGADRDRIRLVGMPEAVAPAPTPWPLLPILTLLICASFLLIQLLPTAQFRGTTDSDPRLSGAGQWRTQQSSGVKIQGWQQQGDQVQDDQGGSVASKSRKSRNRGVHVFLSTDEPDLRPLAVLINSTIVNAR